MGATDLAWDSADAWAFACIGFFEEGRTSLVELIRWANKVNPFLVAEGQLEFTLGKLVGSGLVLIYDDWTMEATDEGAYLLEDVGFEGHRAQVLQQLAQVVPALAKVKVPKRLVESAAE